MLSSGPGKLEESVVNQPLCSGGRRLVLSAHDYKQVVTMDSMAEERYGLKTAG